MSADPIPAGERLGDLVDLEVVSGTAQDPDGTFRGFVTIRATRPDGAYLIGQLSPDELRQHALTELVTAEAAEHDAMVFSVLTRELDITAREAAVVVAAMRRYRADPANRRDTPHLGDPGAPG